MLVAYAPFDLDQNKNVLGYLLDDATPFHQVSQKSGQ